MVAHGSHLLGARRLAEQLFRSLPDFGATPSFSSPGLPEEPSASEIHPSLRSELLELLSRGLLSEDTIEVVLSHPIIAHFASQLLAMDPTALQELVVEGEIRENPLVQLIGDDLTRRAQTSPLKPILEQESPISRDEEASLVGHALNEGTISTTEAVYALCDQIALQQLRRVLRLHKTVGGQAKA